MVAAPITKSEERPFMTFPKRPDSHVIGDRAVQIFRDACAASWVVASITPDYGLDLRIELTQGDEVTGQEVHVQVKGRARSLNERPTVDIRQTTINYWLAKLSPILIALVDTSTGMIWYDWLENAYADYPKQRNKDMKIPLVLSHSTATAPLSEEIPRYAIRFFAQLGTTTNNLSQRARLTEMLLHVVNLTHLFYDVWSYIQHVPKNKKEAVVFQEKLYRFYQEFGNHDIFLQGRWRLFAESSSSPLVLEAFESRFLAYEKLKKTFFTPGPIQQEYEAIPLVGGGHMPPSTLQFITIRLDELISAIGPSIHVLRDIEGLIFRILLLGQLSFVDQQENIKP